MMDAVAYVDGQGFWHVNERVSMRSLGEIVLTAPDRYTIDPDDHSPLAGISAGPYPSLAEALQAIAAHLQGTCELKRSGRRY